jgi:uncharacterized protein
MHDIIGKIGEALLMAFGMFWKTGWSLVLGFLTSAILQAVVSKERMRQALGRDGLKEIALATFLGAASSSCSYASAAISHTLFKKGAALIPSLAFLFGDCGDLIGFFRHLHLAEHKPLAGGEGRDHVDWRLIVSLAARPAHRLTIYRDDPFGDAPGQFNALNYSST